MLTVASLAACGGDGGNDGATTGSPAITVQPQSISAVDGRSATFTVVAGSPTPLSYQWERNRAPIPGATASTYTIATVQLGDSTATFAVVVSNAAGGVRSSDALLTVALAAPVVTGDAPHAVLVTEGQPATLSVMASGSVPLGFQWRRGGAAIAGATSASYVTPATTLSDDAATFDVIVSNGAGTVTSAPFTLSVSALPHAPTIVLGPTAQSARVGEMATFTVQAMGSAPLAYQWSRDGVPIADALAASYVLPSTMLSDTGAAFTVAVTNALGSAVSASASLIVQPQPSIALIAGSVGGQGSTDGIGTTARFESPSGIVTDRSGALYVADSFAIRKVGADGVVTTIAGSSNVGSVDGTGSAARFRHPSGMAIDGAGNLFVADTDNDTIRKVTPAGVVTTFAGQARVPGSADGIGSAARFSLPRGLAFDATGNLLVADSANHTIRSITPAGVVTTIAGTRGFSGSNDGPVAFASFNGPRGLVVDSAGNVLVSEFANTIRRIDVNGIVTTLAGTASASGQVDGIGSAARFMDPQGIAVDAQGNVYVAERFALRKVTPAGAVTTLAGSGTYGSADGIGAAARFNAPSGVAIDSAGNVFVADQLNAEIRRVDSAAVVTTFAGAASGSGSTDGVGRAASFFGPAGVAVDGSRTVYVADNSNQTIRRIAPDGTVSTVAGQVSSYGSIDGVRDAARFAFPFAIAVDASGTLFVADSNDSTIRKVTAAGVVTTLAGSPFVSGTADGTGATARFTAVYGLVVDNHGNLFAVDSVGTIRKVSPAGVVTTIAGRPNAGTSIDGIGSSATFNAPIGIAIDAIGNLYVADAQTIRKIAPDTTVTTLAGTAGQVGSTDGPATLATFNGLNNIAVAPNGDIYVTDYSAATIRRLSSAGVVSTVAGVSDGMHGVKTGALPGHLSFPAGLAFDPDGNLVFSDVDGVLRLALP